LTLGSDPGPFPDRAASLLPGLLAATRTELPPAGDDKLVEHKDTPWLYVTVSPPVLLCARMIGAKAVAHIISYFGAIETTFG
jgi:hypothetical protein